MDDRIAQYYRERKLEAEVESLRAKQARVRELCEQAKANASAATPPNNVCVLVDHVLRTLDEGPT